MTLIKSISGIRGTIGGKVGDNLTPVDAVKFAAAYGTFLKNSKFSKCAFQLSFYAYHFEQLTGKKCAGTFGKFSRDWGLRWSM